MTSERLFEMALALPDTEESTYFGQPSVKRKGRNFLTLLSKEDAVVVKLDWDSRMRFLEDYPEIAYITPHYFSYPSLRLHLSRLTEELAEEVISLAHADAPNPAKRRPGVD